MEGADDKVTCHGRPEGNLCRLKIPDLPHQDDIGVLPEDGAKAVGKGEANLRVYLNLINPFDVILDRVFHSHNIDLS